MLKSDLEIFFEMRKNPFLCLENNPDQCWKEKAKRLLKLVVFLALIQGRQRQSERRESKNIVPITFVGALLFTTY